MSLRILIAPSGFKESLDANEAMEAIAAGILRTLPDAIIHRAPLVDGGEGFTRALVEATGGTLHQLTVTGPVGQAVPSHFGFLGGAGPKTAILEMAAAAGLRLVPQGARDPLQTTTHGVGELIKAALDAGAERILVGCGDSGTNDGGAGAAQALGVRLLDTDGTELGRGGRELAKLAHIDTATRDPRLGQISIKDASPEVVGQLARMLDRYAEVIERDVGVDVRAIPGGGASGGLGAGLSALLGATLHPRYDIVMRYLELDSFLGETDLVITADGSVDFQTPRGKIPAEVARRAKRHDLPVIALAGMIGKDADVNYGHGIDSFLSILQKPCTLDEAIENASTLLENCAERTMRTILVGARLGATRRASGEGAGDGD